MTALFMNGRALGLTSLSGDGGEGDSIFAAADLNGDWSGVNATQISLTGDGGHVSGSGAYVLDGDVYIVYAGDYVLSGELADGSVIIDAGKEDKIRLLLDGVSLHCEDSAAIVVEQAGKVILTLADGTQNAVSCGGTFRADAVSAKIDGTIYSRDDLTINGGGSLTVTAPYKHGIVCNDNLVITGGAIDITAKQDGVHVHDSVSFANANLTVNAGDDGVTVSNDDETAWLYIGSGTISIPSCYEGLEAIDITIAGGVIDIRPTDDGINANGQGRNSVIRITGGDITVINENGRDADGLDSNGSIDISGGNIFISVNTSSYALDYGSENGGVCMISGGTVVAAGGSAMAEGFDASSTQGFLMYTTSAAAGTAVTLRNGAGDTLISETIPCAFSSIVLSAPGLEVGQTVILDVGGAQTELTVDNSGSGGFGFGGMFGGGPGGFFGGRDGRTDGEAPQMPGKGFPDGDMPEDGFMGGGFGGGNMPQLPEDGFPGGQDGGFPGGGDNSQLPGDNLPNGGDGSQMPGEGWDGGRFAQWDQNQDRTQGGGAADAADVFLDTFLPVGVSVLILLAGLAIAFKVRH